MNKLAWSAVALFACTTVGFFWMGATQHWAWFLMAQVQALVMAQFLKCTDWYSGLLDRAYRKGWEQ